MNAPMRRGACPALSAPMATGDGLLVRLNPVSAGLSPATLVRLCEASDRYGNGIVEVTARGSFQIRGLTGASVAGLAAQVDELGIGVRTGVPVETGPLAGLDRHEIADPRRLADAIRAGIATAGLAARLGPKVSVVVDGGGAPWMANVAADVRLTAVATAGGAEWRLAIAGDAASAIVLADLRERAACDATVAILGAIADIGRDARARDLQVNTLDSLLPCLQAERHSTSPPSGLPAISPSRGEIEPAARLSPIATFPAATVDEAAIGKAAAAKLPISPLEGEMSGRTEGGNLARDDGEVSPSIASAHTLIGQHRLADSRVALAVALPFGQVEVSRLAAFMADAGRFGVPEVRLAPRRALLLICLDEGTARAVQAAAKAAGLIVDQRDPRLFISACPGAPACASGRIATRALAEILAEAHGGLIDGTIELHISGCAKGCAHPARAALTIVGVGPLATAVARETRNAAHAEDGGEPSARAALVANGTASAQPLAHIAAGEVAAGLARVAALLRAEHGAGGTTAAALARLEPSKLAEAFEQEPQ